MAEFHEPLQEQNAALVALGAFLRVIHIEADLVPVFALPHKGATTDADDMFDDNE